MSTLLVEPCSSAHLWMRLLTLCVHAHGHAGPLFADLQALLRGTQTLLIGTHALLNVHMQA
jgi:hypothetical protein